MKHNNRNKYERKNFNYLLDEKSKDNKSLLPVLSNNGQQQTECGEETNMVATKTTFEDAVLTFNPTTAKVGDIVYTTDVYDEISDDDNGVLKKDRPTLVIWTNGKICHGLAITSKEGSLLSEFTRYRYVKISKITQNSKFDYNYIDCSQLHLFPNNAITSIGCCLKYNVVLECMKQVNEIWKTGTFRDMNFPGFEEEEKEDDGINKDEQIEELKSQINELTNNLLLKQSQLDCLFKKTLKMKEQLSTKPINEIKLRDKRELTDSLLAEYVNMAKKIVKDVAPRNKDSAIYMAKKFILSDFLEVDAKDFEPDTISKSYYSSIIKRVVNFKMLSEEEKKELQFLLEE